MIDRYIEYLSGIRRYSPRTCEIYRSVLEEYLAFVTADAEPCKASAGGPATTAPGNRATLGIVRGGTAKRWGPKDVSGGWLPGSEEAAQPKYFEVSEEVYARIAMRESTEGVIAEVRTPERRLEELALPERPLVP